MQQLKLEVRQEEPYQAGEVYELNKLVFGQPKEAKIVDALRYSGAFIPELSLLAFHKDFLVGHILFTKIYINTEDKGKVQSLALAPMAVHPVFQKKGIGRLLIEAGLAKAKALGYSSVIVLGHEQYYPKFGFRPTSEWNIKPPFDVPDSVFLGIELTKNALQGMQGTVEYPKQFGII